MQIDGTTPERPAPPLNELLRAGLEEMPLNPTGNCRLKMTAHG